MINEEDFPVYPGSTPWNDEVIARLNKQQQSRQFHPFTCGNRKDIQNTHADGEGVLVATKDGWACPYCDYKQG